MLASICDGRVFTPTERYTGWQDGYVGTCIYNLE